jgi:hypothetical protein
MANYKAPLIKSLREAGFSTTNGWGGPRTTFTHLRKDGNRRMKLWFANDVFEASRFRQGMLEAALKYNYGGSYLGGYFVRGARAGTCGKSFCIVLKM